MCGFQWSVYGKRCLNLGECFWTFKCLVTLLMAMGRLSTGLLMTLYSGGNGTRFSVHKKGFQRNLWCDRLAMAGISMQRVSTQGLSLNGLWTKLWRWMQVVCKASALLNNNGGRCVNQLWNLLADQVFNFKLFCTLATKFPCFEWSTTWHTILI